MYKLLAGFWKATGWWLVIILGILCGGLIWMRHSDGYRWFDTVTVEMALALVFGSYAMLFLYYILGTHSSPSTSTRKISICKEIDDDYVYGRMPGIRDLDGSYDNNVGGSGPYTGPNI